MVLGLDRSQLSAYLGRFATVHLLAYLVVGTGAILVERTLAPADLVAIDFFEPYQLDAWAVVLELLRGLVLAAVVLPFYRQVTDGEWGWTWLFLPLWGLTVIGSIDPWLGSIEGVIYTEITATGHLYVLGATAVQYAILVVVLGWLDRRRPIRSGDGLPTDVATPTPRRLGFWGYLGRFTLVYVAAYLVAGVTFFVLMDYGTVIPESGVFALWRPLDHPFVQFAVLFQLGRGAMLGLLVLSLYSWMFSWDRGWLGLFAVLWGGTWLGAPPTVRNLVTDLLSPGPLADMLFGTTELTVQMLAFAVVFWTWQRRVLDRPGLVGRAVARMAGRAGSRA